MVWVNVWLDDVPGVLYCHVRMLECSYHGESLPSTRLSHSTLITDCLLVQGEDTIFLGWTPAWPFFHVKRVSNIYPVYGRPGMGTLKKDSIQEGFGTLKISLILYRVSSRIYQVDDARFQEWVERIPCAGYTP